MADTNTLNTAIQYAISTGKIQSASDIDLSKSTTGIDSVILRNQQGITVASISKRILKERAENQGVQTSVAQPSPSKTSQDILAELERRRSSVVSQILRNKEQ